MTDESISMYDFNQHKIVEEISLKGQIPWTIDDKLNNFRSCLDIKSGEIWFQVGNNILGKKF